MKNVQLAFILKGTIQTNINTLTAILAKIWLFCNFVSADIVKKDKVYQSGKLTNHSSTERKSWD